MGLFVTQYKCHGFPKGACKINCILSERGGWGVDLLFASSFQVGTFWAKKHIQIPKHIKKTYKNLTANSKGEGVKVLLETFP